MVEGLREMIPREYLSSFDAQELEWVIAGTPEINLDDWKNNTIYWGGVALLNFIINVSRLYTVDKEIVTLYNV